MVVPVHAIRNLRLKAAAWAAANTRWLVAPARCTKQALVDALTMKGASELGADGIQHDSSCLE